MRRIGETSCAEKWDWNRHYDHAGGLRGEEGVISSLSPYSSLTDAAGDIVWEAMYEAFGKAAVDPESTLTNNLRFPGQYYDEETGLHYNWNRYYDPNSGRYIQKDPIGFKGGDENLYRYGGNPLSFADPLGLQRNYQVSNNYIKFLEEYEQLRNDVHDDGYGNLTVGIGHKLLPSEIRDQKYKDGLTEDEAYALCRSDLGKFIKIINGKLDVDLTQNQFDAIIDLAYNLGPNSKLVNSVIDSVSNGKFISQSMFTDYISATVIKNGKAVKVKSNGLLDRRIDEYEMFTYGDYRRDPHVQNAKKKNRKKTNIGTTSKSKCADCHR